MKFVVVQAIQSLKLVQQNQLLETLGKLEAEVLVAMIQVNLIISLSTTQQEVQTDGS
jgi:hypothetical protein